MPIIDATAPALIKPFIRASFFMLAVSIRQQEQLSMIFG